MRSALSLRFADSPDGVFSWVYLLEDGRVVDRVACMEDDWLNNEARESCIPAARYRCKRSTFNKGNPPYPCFEFMNVPGRSLVKTHIANTEENVEGCLGMGLDFGALTVADEDLAGHPMRLKWAVTGSKPGFAKFMDFFAGYDVIDFEIRWATPGEWRRFAA